MRVKTIYKIARGIMVGCIVVPAILYIFLYIALSLPPVQNTIRERAEKELSQFFGANVSIGDVEIHPFNQVVVSDVDLPSPDGKPAVKVERLGAGINLQELIFNRKLVFTHAELIGLDGHIVQESPDSPLNIDFIIKTFAPKDKNKPPTRFDFKVHNIIIRRSNISFDKEWIPATGNERMNFSHLALSDFRADIELPLMKNDDFNIIIRRLAFKEKSGFILESLKGEFHISPDLLAVSGLEIMLPGSLVKINDQKLRIDGYDKIPEAIRNSERTISLTSAKVTPADLKAFVPFLSRFTDPFYINLSAEGNIDRISIHNLFVNSAKSSLSLETSGLITGITDRENFSMSLPEIKLTSVRSETQYLLSQIAAIPASAREIIDRAGDVELDAQLNMTAYEMGVNGKIFSSLGLLNLDSHLGFPSGAPLHISGKAESPDFALGSLTGYTGIGSLAFNATADMTISKGNFNGFIEASVPYIEAYGRKWQNIEVNIEKDNGYANGTFSVEDPDILLKGTGNIQLAGADTETELNLDLGNVNFAHLPVKPSLKNLVFSGEISASAVGNSIRTVNGNARISDLIISRENRPLKLGDINIDLTQGEEAEIRLDSKFLSGTMSGRFNLTDLPASFLSVVSNAFPNTFAYGGTVSDAMFDYHFTIPADNTLPEYFKLPVRLLSEIEISGSMNQETGLAALSINAPYLQQGKDKLISDTRISLVSSDSPGNYILNATSLVPAKRGEVRVNLNATAHNDMVDADISWKADATKNYSGNISLSALLSKIALGKGTGFDIGLNPSSFTINDTVWQINPARILYAGKNLDIQGLKLNNESQSVAISGRASANTGDSIYVDLNNMDLDYIFETLNINYVTFGGRATGNVRGTDLFTTHPIAFTDNLHVADLSYNGGRLGDALISSRWNNRNKSVEIKADITDEGHRAALVDGAVFVTRDSLGFSLDAKKVNISFLKPFMAVFSSDIRGRASGKATLYGTFSDIDLKGRIFADTILMKLDYTNTWYGGSDSVIIDPGHIRIPAFTLYDKFGKTAILNGEVNHRYFHDPSFRFIVSDAANFLCYDTDAVFNPDWYGTIYGNGGASITGHPGIVDILVEMTTAPGSVFTLVLNDLESAADYKFLTFTDKRKEQLEALKPDTVPEIVRLFRKRVADRQQEIASTFNIDLRANVTPDAEAVIVMDPIGGDRIRTTGSGGLQIGYNSRTDRMSMYGKYTLDNGKYNFTLQDIILKDFTIRPGSSISFNGDPFNALLNIDAAYKVNTNISDLDPSFSNDRDLNRTSVPVEAILKVTGQLQSPEINFDIELPTLTQEVTRKVKSIISTEDMMNRQIIYLLALNRFYTPEYMGNSGNGGEFTSLASSTISSQISNMLANLTDKWTIAPNFRSDNGTFSDLELDLNLSSSLLNNRLLLNGNLGYRDKSTSSTTFIGDFDLEYLLNRRGNLRLKAYNHFNDKNYYLKSSLTTQGVGILYKHDFDRWFSFLRRRSNQSKEKADSVVKK